MKELKEKYGKYIIIITLLILAFIFNKVKSYEEDILIVNDLEENIINTDDELDIITVEDEEIMVHLSGEVNNPGLIRLNKGERLFNAIDIAGGLKENADLKSINLARKLLDEEKIHIPKFGEEISEDNNLEPLVEVSKSKLININNSSKDQLTTLPGIGDKTADKIMDYRELNPFNKIEDIKNVPGIGEKKFDAIKDLISVN